MENPIKMDDLGVPLFLETSVCWLPVASGQYSTLRKKGGGKMNFLFGWPNFQGPCEFQRV